MIAVVQARDDVGLKWGTRGIPSSAPLCRSQELLQFVLARKAYGKEKNAEKPLKEGRRQDWEITQGFSCPFSKKSRHTITSNMLQMCELVYLAAALVT